MNRIQRQFQLHVQKCFRKYILIVCAISSVRAQLSVQSCNFLARLPQGICLSNFCECLDVDYQYYMCFHCFSFGLRLLHIQWHFGYWHLVLPHLCHISKEPPQGVPPRHSAWVRLWNHVGNRHLGLVCCQQGVVGSRGISHCLNRAWSCCVSTGSPCV